MLARARAVTLTNYAEVARYAGLDPFVMLGRAGLHPGAMRDPEHWLPANRILALLDLSAARSGHDDFGVLLGESRSFASLGPVSLLLRHEATLREVMLAMIEYRRLLNDLLEFELRDEGQITILEWSLIPGLRSSQGIILLATIAYRVLVDGAGCNWQPECIHFRQSPPQQLATFRRVFRCSLEFNSSFDGLSCSSDCLGLANRFAETELAEHARRLLGLLPGIRPDTVYERARSTIPFLISNGRTHVRDVAKCLGISARTLQRELAVEGQSFSNLLNDARRELVMRYVTDSNQSLLTVAHLVGYSTLSSFTRWFASEFGMSPGRWRKHHKQRHPLYLVHASVADAAGAKQG